MFDQISKYIEFNDLSITRITFNNKKRLEKRCDRCLKAVRFDCFIYFDTHWI